MSVFLNEEDIPGSSLAGRNLAQIRFRVEEYINQGKDGFLVDPDPDLIYTKRKLGKQNELADTNTAN